ncbi:hypothetical protein J6590_072912 [Homalodisca vitripennis]|nr:hypothetical protein J6590_072912 [Homalodisca vitripennis]
MADFVDVRDVKQYKPRLPTLPCDFKELYRFNVLHFYGDEYINHKGKPTLNEQATCDASEKFTSVDLSWPGSVHDSRIWKTSHVILTGNRKKWMMMKMMIRPMMKIFDHFANKDKK